MAMTEGNGKAKRAGSGMSLEALADPPERTSRLEYPDAF
jgi:hypothetical protein